MTRLSPGPQFVARVLAGKSATPAEIASIFKQLYLMTTSIKQAFPITISLVIGASIIWR